MERNTLLKLFALIVVLAFIISSFSSRDDTTGQQEQTGQEIPLTYGKVLNGTIVEYDTIIYLKTRNLTKNYTFISFSQKNSDGTIGAVLKEGTNVTDAARILSKDGITTVGKARVKLNVPIETNSSKIEYLDAQIEPIVNVGETINMRALLLILGDNVPQSQVTLLKIPASAYAEVEAVSLTNNYRITCEYSWAGRNSVNVSEEEQKFKEVNFSVFSINFTPASYVMLDRFLDENETKKIKNFSYVKDAFDIYVVIEENYTDNGTIANDFGNMGLGVEFPPSQLTANVTLNESASINNTPCENYTTRVSKILKINGEARDDSGKKYFTKNDLGSLFVPYNAKTLTISISGNSYGDVFEVKEFVNYWLVDAVENP